MWILTILCVKRSRRDRLQITVYLDIIFLINLIADFWILLLTGIIARKKIIFWRVMVGTVFAATLLFVVLLTPSRMLGWKGVVITIGISMGAVAISYWEKNLSFFRTWFLSTTIMVLLGCIMNYLRYIFGVSILQMLTWMLLFSVSSICIVFFMFFIQKTSKKNKDTYLIQIKHGNETTLETVYMDTGNLLMDPLFQKPVVILSEKVVNKLLREEERSIVEEYKKAGMLDYEMLLSSEGKYMDCFHEIAYQSVGNPTGKMLCILIDEITIIGEKKVLQKQPVGIVLESMFEGKIYQGLLHKKCI